MKRNEAQEIIDSCLAELTRAAPEQRTIWRENFHEQFGCDPQVCLTEVYKGLLLDAALDELRGEVAELLLKIAQCRERTH